MLNEPLWTLTVAPDDIPAAGIPNCPLDTFTQGRVAIPSETSIASFIVPVGVLEKPTSFTIINSSPIFNKSEVVTDEIPLKISCVTPTPILGWCVNPSKTPNVCVIDVNVIGCWTTPSKPMIVLVNCLVIVNLWLLPDPNPVNVTAAPVATYSRLVNNWNLFSSETLANTVLGNIVVTTPAIFAVCPMDTAVAATPINEESGV